MTFTVPVNRIMPNAPVGAYQTFTVVSPLDRTVKSACEEVACAAWQFGWRTIVDEATAVGREQAAYIRTRARRTYSERPAGALTEFVFDSRQRCFAEHRTRPEIYVVRGGDWRGNPKRERRTHQRAADWVEHMDEQLHTVADQSAAG